MKHLIQLIINALARRLNLYGTPDTDKVIRVLKVENLRLKKERTEMQQELKQQQQGFTTVYIDPLMRQRGYAQSAWNSEPSPRTDPALQARLEAQKRKNDMKAFLKCDSGELPHIPGFNAPTNVRSGELMRQHTTRKLTIANTDTVNVPAVPRMPHKPNLMLHSGLYPGETAHSTPAFLQDQDKKIS